MKTITILLAALLVLPLTALAEDRYSGVTMIRGTVISVGRVDPTENIDTGFFVDANYSSVAINGGIATKKFGDSPIRSATIDGTSAADGERVNNAYLGTGFGRFIQIQYGHGNHDGLIRYRSDFNYRDVVDFFSGRRTPKDRFTLGDRLTFTIAIEQYLEDEEEIFDNATWGIGLLF
ncbi:MAG: hypothetical protein CL537_05465 [Alcanivoracaceae bacterium]|uniref:hypothetical protein n=1 Tax=Alcanivorax sp. MD8A TaxID=1177157 RepID=UPI000C60E5EE|nr:hypothetical protein [Alcanivorax sp. MD8A]MAX54946.1 hypothetical protein [Alcanivoracaceae bacterium]MCG8437464.1 hypothetical protein [Pseudomonadales bacterium]MED5389620.1 hypothetical protein [Pseudomonadota bacterium]MEE2870531.1 hypothetical protein [Pseudomonadota bacterium]PNE03592.1 hypothetical protein A15D_00812 [Alcanivorax sp. MD8A]|tara:strand:- start:4510 stop:5040 length:531 start_codon:yes stop_codon:yes gene_type:complete